MDVMRIPLRLSDSDLQKWRDASHREWRASFPNARPETHPRDELLADWVITSCGDAANETLGVVDCHIASIGITIDLSDANYVQWRDAAFRGWQAMVAGGNDAEPDRDELLVEWILETCNEAAEEKITDGQWARLAAAVKSKIKPKTETKTKAKRTATKRTAAKRTATKTKAKRRG